MKRIRHLPAFSLLEVLFSVAMLILVGLGVISLNVAALRLIIDSEVKTSAYGLNDESIAYISALYKNSSNPAAFAATINGHGCANANTCYVACPIEPINSSCSLSATPHIVQLGRNKLQFTRPIKLVDKEFGSYLVHTKVVWGTGPNRQAEAHYYLGGLQ